MNTFYKNTLSIIKHHPYYALACSIFFLVVIIFFIYKIIKLIKAKKQQDIISEEEINDFERNLSNSKSNTIKVKKPKSPINDKNFKKNKEELKSTFSKGIPIIKTVTPKVIKNDINTSTSKEIKKTKPQNNEVKNKDSDNLIDNNSNTHNSSTSPKIKQPKQSNELPTPINENDTKLENIKFVEYDVRDKNNSASFPIVLIPKYKTVVRSFRIGNTKLRGYKEESFQKTLEINLGSSFEILGNVRLNTGKNTRPFEPDIAIIDNYSGFNLRIDIEIDEPYAGITRQPTHCKGDDTNRDLYFIDRGWVVIRFSEFQIHHFELECIKYIAEIIKNIIPDYSISKELLDCKNLEIENLWDIVQAQKWDKEKYREKYLNHTFEIIQETKETGLRDLNDQEKEEEKNVKQTSFGKVDNKKQIEFNLLNTHARDKRIKFYPEPHIYTIDKTPAPSVSTIISKFFPEFDTVYWSNNKSISLGMTPNEVAKMWKENGDESAKKGSHLHEQIENYFLKQEHLKNEEFVHFESFINEHSHIVPFRTEWRIFDEEYHIAGTIDLIVKNNSEYEMYDWKRSKKIINSYNLEPITENKWQNGIGILSEIPDTSFNRYCLQQSIYKFILEKNYQINVSNMFLVVLHPIYETYYKIEVPYLKDKAEFILSSFKH